MYICVFAVTNRELRRLTREVSDLGQEVEKLADEVDGVGNEAENVTDKIDRLEDEVESVVKEVSELRTEVLNLQEQLKNGMDDLTTRLSIWGSMQKDINRTAQLLQELQQQVTVISHQSSKESQDIKATLHTGVTRVVSEVESVCNASKEDSLQVAAQYVPSSCSELASSPPGYYQIRSPSSGETVTVYCDTTRHCCNSTGGWMRVANLDTTDHTQQCPSGFRLKTDPKRVCVRTTDRSCTSITFPVHGVQYSKVCGQVRGYQVGSPDAFGHRQSSVTIDNNYVDGVSITHGALPRHHIWTFAAAHDERISDGKVCPCTKTDTTYTGHVPPFNGNDYFCETGTEQSAETGRFYPEDPLWDGKGCGPTSSCCQFNSPPWFCKELPQPTTDDIEVRVCANEAFTNEDVAIELIELYLQ